MTTHNSRIFLRRSSGGVFGKTNFPSKYILQHCFDTTATRKFKRHGWQSTSGRAYWWNVFRLVCGGDTFAEGLKQRLQSEAVHVLGGVSAGEVLSDCRKLLVKRCHVAERSRRAGDGAKETKEA
jgi:hypothetical protein